MNIQERKDELIAAAKHSARLRVLFHQELLGFLSDDQATSDFLEFAYADQIKDHLTDCCQCDLTNGGYGFCYIGQWAEGCRSAWEVITDMDTDCFAFYFKQYFKSL